MSLRAYARYRGDALSAVQKAIASGRVRDDAVRRDASGKLMGIEQTKADLQWTMNTDPDEALRNQKWPAEHLTRESPQPEREAPDGLAANQLAATDEDSRAFIEARAREKQFQAKQAELNYLERLEVVVSADEVRGEQIQIIRELRDKLEQLPVRIAHRLASETDPMRVEHLLISEIRNTLNELSRTFAGDDDGAAGGSEERSTVTA